MFSSFEGDRGECQECSSVVIVLFTCQYAVYKFMSVCMISHACSINGVWWKVGRRVADRGRRRRPTMVLAWLTLSTSFSSGTT